KGLRMTRLSSSEPLIKPSVLTTIDSNVKNIAAVHGLTGLPFAPKSVNEQTGHDSSSNNGNRQRQRFWGIFDAHSTPGCAQSRNTDIVRAAAAFDFRDRKSTRLNSSHD